MKWLIPALFLSLPSNALAQASGQPAYVFGGLSLPWQEGATSDEYRTYLAAPGGWSAGFLLGGGVRLTRFLSIEGEWHRTGIMETTEPSRYEITYSAQRRDTTFAFGGRVHLALARGFALEPVGLIELVREESWLAQRHEPPYAPPSGSLTDHSPFVDSWGTGVAGGVDLRAGSARVAFMPGVRLHRFWRDERAESTWPGGRSTWGLEISFAVRTDF